MSYTIRAMSYILIGCLKKELRALFGNLFLFSTKALKNNKLHVWMVCKVMVLCCLNWAHNFFSFLWFVLGYKWKIEGSCGSRDVYQINRHTLGKVPTFFVPLGWYFETKNQRRYRTCCDTWNVISFCDKLHKNNMLQWNFTFNYLWIFAFNFFCI